MRRPALTVISFHRGHVFKFLGAVDAGVGQAASTVFELETQIIAESMRKLKLAQGEASKATENSSQ